jgi:hypothetical protein
MAAFRGEEQCAATGRSIVRVVGLGFRAADDHASIQQESLFIAQASRLPINCLSELCSTAQRRCPLCR